MESEAKKVKRMRIDFLNQKKEITYCRDKSLPLTLSRSLFTFRLAFVVLTPDTTFSGMDNV